MKKKNYLAIAMLAAISGSSFADSVHGLTALTDTELSAETGQALFNLTYTAPTDTVNLERTRLGGDTTMGFYKLGMEADLELNINARKLQLGCGGVNGAGGCDIDIDYVSLSGVGTTPEARASSSAKLVNPFIELAISNPGSAALRQFKGLRLSSEAAYGLISFGLENGTEKSGINSLSGYMEVAATTGSSLLNPVSNLTYQDTNKKMTGRVKDTFGIPLSFESDNYSLNLTPASPASLTLAQQAITGKRISSANLQARAVVNNIQLSGRMVAVAAGLNLDKGITGTLNNLVVGINIDQSLAMVHKADLNGSPASLSLQSQGIQWPGTKSVAQPGWWLELSNPINIGKIDTSSSVDIALSTIVQSLDKVNAYLYEPGVQCGFLWLSCIGGSNIDTGPINLTTPANNGVHATMNLRDLVLAEQNFAPNCYGGLKFC